MSALLEMTRVVGAERSAAISQRGRVAHLTELLRQTFEVSERLLGRERFGDLARDYLDGRPAPATRLSSHSMGFPAFLTRSSLVAETPYLVDLARLELAVRRMRHSPIRPSQDLDTVHLLARGQSDFLFDLQLSVQFLLVRWPVLELWQRHQAGYTPGHDGLCRRTQRLQIVNNDGVIAFRDTSRATFAFRHGLLSGYTLEHAVRRALKRDPFFDLVSELLGLFDDALVVGIRRIASSHIPTTPDQETPP